MVQSRLIVSVGNTLAASAYTSTRTPANGLEITVTTIFPSDAGEVMVTAPEVGCKAPCGWVTRGDEMFTMTEPPIIVLA